MSEWTPERDAALVAHFGLDDPDSILPEDKIRIAVRDLRTAWLEAVAEITTLNGVVEKHSDQLTTVIRERDAALGRATALADDDETATLVFRAGIEKLARIAAALGLTGAGSCVEERMIAAAKALMQERDAARDALRSDERQLCDDLILARRERDAAHAANAGLEARVVRAEQQVAAVAEERDAALARAERAEAERDGARVHSAAMKQAAEKAEIRLCPECESAYSRHCPKCEDRSARAFASGYRLPSTPDWRAALADAGLERDDLGWSRPESRAYVIGQRVEGVIGAEPSLVRWWQAEEDVPAAEIRTFYDTEEEAARAWLAAQGGERG